MLYYPHTLPGKEGIYMSPEKGKAYLIVFPDDQTVGNGGDSRDFPAMNLDEATAYIRIWCQDVSNVSIEPLEGQKWISTAEEGQANIQDWERRSATSGSGNVGDHSAV